MSAVIIKNERKRGKTPYTGLVVLGLLFAMISTMTAAILLSADVKGGLENIFLLDTKTYSYETPSKDDENVVVSFQKAASQDEVGEFVVWDNTGEEIQRTKADLEGGSIELLDVQSAINYRDIVFSAYQNDIKECSIYFGNLLDDSSFEFQKLYSKECTNPSQINQFTLSPSGTHLAFIKNEEIVVIDILASNIVVYALDIEINRNENILLLDEQNRRIVLEDENDVYNYVDGEVEFSYFNGEIKEFSPDLTRYLHEEAEGISTEINLTNAKNDFDIGSLDSAFGSWDTIMEVAAFTPQNNVIALYDSFDGIFVGFADKDNDSIIEISARQAENFDSITDIKVSPNENLMLFEGEVVPFSSIDGRAQSSYVIYNMEQQETLPVLETEVYHKPVFLIK